VNGRPQVSSGARFAWCLYDWANSAFPTIIVTFVFSTYFVKSVAEDEITGAVQWGYAMSLSGLAIAITAPIVGAISDKRGGKKSWLGVFSIICIAGAALTWFVRPEAEFVIVALVLIAVSNAAFEICMVFYNSMLVDVAPPGRMGWMSGWAWGLGYFGGLTCLILAYVSFIAPETPLLGLDKSDGALEHIRFTTGPVVAVWFSLFALPLFLFVPEGAASRISMAKAAREGLATLWSTIREVRRYRQIAIFLLARLFFIDGLNTMFAFGAIYAAAVFSLDAGEIFQFAIALNVSAGIGAVALGYLDDRLGSKATIFLALGGLLAFGAPLLIIESKLWFWLLAVPLGLFMGPTQAASRTMMARLAPAEMEAEMFGLFAFSGKVTAFLGPAAYAWFTDAFQTQRAGMATIFVFIVIGALLLTQVREPART
jgi:UMF1 family MFS transporter